MQRAPGILGRERVERTRHQDAHEPQWRRDVRPPQDGLRLQLHVVSPSTEGTAEPPRDANHARVPAGSWRGEMTASG